MSDGSLPLTPTFLDGVCLAANAVPDLCVVIDSGECGTEKLGKVGFNHDLTSDLLLPQGRERVRYSRLRAEDLVLGTQDKLMAAARSVVADCAPSLLLLVQSSAVQLLAQDVDSVAEDLAGELGVEVAVLDSRTLNGDYLDGYESVVEAVIGRAVLSEEQERRGRAVVSGFFCDRLEEDQQGNLREIRRLVQAAGYGCERVVPDGLPLREPVGAVEALLALPYARRASERLAERMACDRVDLPLPLGLDATIRFMRALGEHFGSEQRVDAFVDRELGHAVPLIDKVIRRSLLGRNVAVLADPVLASPLSACLEVLGMRVRCVGLLTRDDGLAETARIALASCAPEAVVVADPGFVETEELWKSLHGEGRLDVVVGSGGAREAARGLELPYLELGYPSFVRHAIYDAPWMGFRGVRWLAGALAQRLDEWAFRRG